MVIQQSAHDQNQVLLSGCRCIELDFWDGEDDPIITHGYTIVNKLPAKDVIQAIAECAFKTSDFPLILSFENHCKFKQQEKIAKYCKESFGDMLLEEPLDDHPLDPQKVLPSPDRLRGKILIKNKKRHPHHSKPHHSSNPVTPSKRAELRNTSSNNNVPSSPVPGIDVPDIPGIPEARPNDYPDSDSDSDSDSDEDSMDSGEVATQPNTTGAEPLI